MDPGHQHPRRYSFRDADGMQVAEEDIWVPPPSEGQPKVALAIGLGVR